MSREFRKPIRRVSRLTYAFKTWLVKTCNMADAIKSSASKQILRYISSGVTGDECVPVPNLNLLGCCFSLMKVRKSHASLCIFCGPISLRSCCVCVSCRARSNFARCRLNKVLWAISYSKKTNKDKQMWLSRRLALTFLVVS